jgi:DDE superfamily endonuclease
MTRLTEPEFTALLPHFEHALAAYLQDRTIEGQPRTSRRDRTYDHCPWPTIADKQLFILTYVKQHPIQEVPGQLFRMSPSHANTWIPLLHAVLNQAWAHQDLLPARNADDWAVMLAAKRTEGVPVSPLFGMMVRSDRIHRPADPEDQQDYDSGKKKCYTLKNLLVIEETCQICFLSATYEGKAHDQILAELEGYIFPPGSCLDQDMGFQGYTCEGITIMQSKKTPPGGALTPPGESSQSCHLVHPHPDRTRHWRGETLPDGQRQNPPLERRYSRYHYGDVLWIA